MPKIFNADEEVSLRGAKVISKSDYLTPEVNVNTTTRQASINQFNNVALIVTGRETYVGLVGISFSVRFIHHKSFSTAYKHHAGNFNFPASNCKTIQF